jgi:hypothetical protein
MGTDVTSSPWPLRGSRATARCVGSSITTAADERPYAWRLEGGAWSHTLDRE